MKLYFSPGACSLAPHIALMEGGYKFESIRVDLKSKKLPDGGDFCKINPKGYVPTIQLDGGEVLTEGAVLLQYIADQKPEKNLFPKFGGLDRYKAQEWLNFISTELHKGFSPLFNYAAPEEYKTMAKETLYKKFDFLNTHFENNQFILGGQFSVVDAYAFTVLNWTNFIKMDLAKWPNIVQFMKRMSDRPAVREAMIAEGLLKN